MVVCGGGGVTTTCGDAAVAAVGDDRMMVTNTATGECSAGAADYHHHSHLHNLLNDDIGDISAAGSLCDEQMIVDDQYNPAHLLHQQRRQLLLQPHKFFSSTPMLTALKLIPPPIKYKRKHLKMIPVQIAKHAALEDYAPSGTWPLACLGGTTPTMSAGQCGGVAPDNIFRVSPNTQYLPIAPITDVQHSCAVLIELETKTLPALSLINQPRDAYEISGRMRNGSCHVLRCLKVWYELPSETFFLAINTMDRFLTRMRAQPKHLSCIAVSAFHLACEEMSRESGRPVPSRDSVSAISQSKCTSNDVSRMGEIIRNKMEMPYGAPLAAGAAAPVFPSSDQMPVTPLTALKTLYFCHAYLAQNFFKEHPINSLMPDLVPIIQKLEVVVCDTRAANFRPSELAIALLKRVMLQQPHDLDPEKIRVNKSCLEALIGLCKTNPRSLAMTMEIVSRVLLGYDRSYHGYDDTMVDHRQRLVWKLSNRTLRQLRPTDKFRKHRRMETISEKMSPELCEESEEDESTIMESSLEDSGSTGEQDDDCQEVDVGEDESMETNEEEQGLYETKHLLLHATGGGEEERAVVEEEEKMEEEEDAIEETLVIARAEEQQQLLTASDGETTSQEDKEKDEQTSSNDKEESYSQVAKKMREDDKSPKLPDSKRKALMPLPMSSLSPIFHSFIQTSPLSKITLTPVLTSSSAVRNLSHLLEKAAEPSDGEAGYYNYHRRPFIGILGIEGIDGDVLEDQSMACISSQSSSATNNAKRRKKPRVLQIVAQPSYDSFDSEMHSENASSSSEEEIDSDYEKDFPPLPLPRSSHSQKLVSVRKKTSSAAPMKKKKKKSDASPYAAKSKAMRKLHARKMVAQK